MIKCACGDELCEIRIRFETNRLWFTDPDGKESLAYLDPNTIVEFIRELRAMLLRTAEED